MAIEVITLKNAGTEMLEIDVSFNMKEKGRELDLEKGIELIKEANDLLLKAIEEENVLFTHEGDTICYSTEDKNFTAEASYSPKSDFEAHNSFEVDLFIKPKDWEDNEVSLQKHLLNFSLSMDEEFNTVKEYAISNFKSLIPFAEKELKSVLQENQKRLKEFKNK